MATHEIVRGSERHVEWMMGEFQKFSDFYGTKKSPLGDLGAAKANLEECMIKHLVLVSEKHGHPTGFIVGLLSPHLFNADIKVLTEVLWWVAEEHRGTRAGYLLFKEFTQIGKEVADWTIITTEVKSNVRDETIISMGYRHYETVFLMEN